MTWPIKKLGEVVELHYGKGITKFDRKANGNYPIYGANGELGRTDKYLVEGKAIIVGRKGSAGEVTRVSGKFWPADVTYYIFGNNTIDIDFLFYFFKLFDLRRFAIGVKPGINRNRAYETEIPLPPLEIQKKVVKKIEELFAKIDQAQSLRESATQNTDDLIPATLSKIFEEGRKRYKPAELGNVASLVRGPFGGSLRKDTFVNSGDCVYEQGNVIDNNLENFRYFVTPEKFGQMRRFSVSSGDILMSCSGTIGKFLIIPKIFKKGIINQALLKITPNQNIIVDYLKYALQDYLSLSKTHIKGMAIKNIAAVKELKKFKLSLPPLAEQRKIVMRMDALTQKVRELQILQSETAANLTALKQSILHKAFQGELIN